MSKVIQDSIVRVSVTDNTVVAKTEKDVLEISKTDNFPNFGEFMYVRMNDYERFSIYNRNELIALRDAIDAALKLE